MAALLRRFGYDVTRQTGSHLRVTSAVQGVKHHVTIPRHRELRVGTLSSILGDVAGYLGRSREELGEDLFG